MNSEDKDQNAVVDIILNLIKQEQDYTEEEMKLFTSISVDTKLPGIYLVRLETQDITLDFT